MSNAETVITWIAVILKAMPLMVWVIIAYTVISSIKKAREKSMGNNVVVDISGRAIGTNDYVHPCAGQCKDPNLILNKSPTPMYKHHCRAPCFFASRSGRYYKGKQRKRTW